MPPETSKRFFDTLEAYESDQNIRKKVQPEVAKRLHETSPFNRPNDSDKISFDLDTNWQGLKNFITDTAECFLKILDHLPQILLITLVLIVGKV